MLAKWWIFAKFGHTANNIHKNVQFLEGEQRMHTACQEISSLKNFWLFSCPHYLPNKSIFSPVHVFVLLICFLFSFCLRLFFADIFGTQFVTLSLSRHLPLCVYVTLFLYLSLSIYLFVFLGLSLSLSLSLSLTYTLPLYKSIWLCLCVHLFALITMNWKA